MAKQEQTEPKQLCKELQYLIGVPSQYIDNFDALHKGVMVEIRKLCALRSTIIANFSEINNEFKNRVQLADITYTTYLVSDLAKLGFEIQNSGSLSRNVIELNTLIDSRIEGATLHFRGIPREWIYELFHMPNGDDVEGVRVAVRKYRKFKNYYPYQKYINWPFEETPEEKRSQNILRNDTLLHELLANIHRNRYTDLLDFAGVAGDAVVVVDCENSDAQRLYEAMKFARRLVSKIILIDDTHTNKMWDELVQEYREDGIQIEHDELPRLKKEKSLVDLRMVAKTCEEFYKNNVQHFIFVSSDSDLWALICSLPEAKILVLAERCKSGETFIETLTQSNIQVIFMEDIIEPSTELMDRIMRRKLKELKTNTYIEARRMVVTAAQELNLFLDKDTIDRYTSELCGEIVTIEEALEGSKVITVPKALEEFMKPNDAAATVSATVEPTMEAAVDPIAVPEPLENAVEVNLNACEIEALRTHNEWYTGHTTEKPDKVVIKVYDSAGKFKESINCPSVYYPLSGKYEVFNYTNTHLIGDSEEDQRILTIFDKIPYKVGNCYVNAEAMTKALCEAGYKAQTYVGWMLTQNEVVHHAWTVLWVHDRPSVLDLADYLTEMDKMIPPDEKMPIEQLREMMADATVKLMQRPHHERCAPVGIPTPFYYFVGSPSNEAEGRALFRKLVAQFPDHPCMARMNKNKGRIPTQDLIRKKLGK